MCGGRKANDRLGTFDRLGTIDRLGTFDRLREVDDFDGLREVDDFVEVGSPEPTFPDRRLKLVI